MKRPRAEARGQVRGLPRGNTPGRRIAFAGLPPLGAAYDFDFRIGCFENKKPRQAGLVVKWPTRGTPWTVLSVARSGHDVHSGEALKNFCESNDLGPGSAIDEP
jgi:hypothetical protein